MRQKLLVISPFLGRSGMERNLAYFFHQYDKTRFEIGFAFFQQLYPKSQTSPLQESLTNISRTWQLKAPRSMGVFAIGEQLSRLMDQWQPDVVLGKEWFAACAAVFARNHLSVHTQTQPRVVALIENDPHLAFELQIASERLSAAKRLVYKHLLKKCDRVIGVSKGVTQETGRVFGVARQKLHTVYNGVDIDLIQQQAQAIPSHQWLKPTRNHVSGIPVMVSCARLSPEKDLATLVRAMALVNKKKRVQLIVLGEGQELGALQSLAKQLGVSDFVDFAGYSPNPFSYIAHADAFVMTSLSEGFPSVLLEAMACETPVVYTDCHFGPGEIIESGKNGLLVSVGQPAEVAEAILKIVDDPSLSKKFVSSANQTIKNFTVKKSVQELSQFLQ